MIKTGIFGGSFNPIHRGHVALAQAIRERAGLDEVWMMVSPQNPLKRQADLLDDGLRLQMVRRAIADEPGLAACDYEFSLPRPSYTWDTLEHLRKDEPQRCFSLIIGADNWQLFPRWYRAEELMDRYALWIYPRPGYTVDVRSLPRNARFIEAPLMDISSTEIRRRVRCGAPIDELVPAAIIDDVKQYYADTDNR
ncbi:MAG: nicotinate-nucleotide adenylyltransferase [Prevotella sp.]|nr:nicotinate-nucleotide adenylyltransferase [Prevotella sp.]